MMYDVKTAESATSHKSGIETIARSVCRIASDYDLVVLPTVFAFLPWVEFLLSLKT